MRRAILLLGALLLAPSGAGAWNVACKNDAGVECPDGFAKVRTPWRADPQSEHRRLLERTLEISGLPAALQATFELTVHTDDAPLAGPDGASYTTIRPVRFGARKIQTRELSVQAMANLPDNAYTLWDWAAGNELCPPDRGNPDQGDCHDYETHIGWLNSNHMLPQSQRFYEHLHRLALDRAAECKRMHDAVPEVDRLRLRRYLLACEAEALVIEGVGHHYLQDSWSMGHMWERWGGVEISDFGGNRPLGFAIGAFTGTIHGAGAMIPFGAADDPMCAPHPDEQYVDDPDTTPREHLGVGDVYLEDFLFQPNGAWADQRRALLGCAVDGVRAVYTRTAQVHGPMVAPDATQFDASRHVTDPTCWRQRATNKAIATGCGIHLGKFPGQVEALGGAAGAALIAGILPLALSSVAVDLVGLQEILPLDQAAAFARDAAYACTVAAAYGAIPGLAQQTNLAEGGLPSLVGIKPNSFYARGNAFSTPLVPPSSYADPALPWDLDAASDRAAKEALNLTFADAHAADRCRTVTEADLERYRSEVALAKAVGDDEVTEARCSQCAQLVAPHLRFGVQGNHDARREAFCALVGAPSPAFVFTEENPVSFIGNEPTDLDSIRTATRTWCGCNGEPPPVTFTSAALSAQVLLSKVVSGFFTATGSSLGIADSETVTATMPITTVTFQSGADAYGGAGTSAATRTVSRLPDSVKIDLTNQRSITLSVNPLFAGGIRLAATVSDLWCTELDRGVRVTFTADPPSLEMFNPTSGDFAFGTGQADGTRTLPTGGRWCVHYLDENRLGYDENTRLVVGDPAAQANYSVTLQSPP